jgi:hypothetical protein
MLEIRPPDPFQKRPDATQGTLPKQVGARQACHHGAAGAIAPMRGWVDHKGAARDNESQTVRLFWPNKTGRPRDLGAPDLRRSGGARRSQQIEVATGKKIKRARKSLESIRAGKKRRAPHHRRPLAAAGGAAVKSGTLCGSGRGLWSRLG